MSNENMDNELGNWTPPLNHHQQEAEEMVGVRPAIEWKDELRKQLTGATGRTYLPLERDIEPIQLDAYTAGRITGMVEAASICVDHEQMQPITQSEINTGEACKCAILTAAGKVGT